MALVEAGVELISARHECNAASMADAYAKATGELTLVSVHSGPGLTNALTGIGEAAKSRTPLVVLAGDVPNGAVKNNFYIEQAEMVRAVGAVSERLHTPASAREDALRAVTRALARPADRGAQHAARRAACAARLESAAARTAAGARPPASRSAGHRTTRRCAAARAAPAHPRRPRRGDRRRRERRLLALAERAGALLATSVCGHGLFSGNPWSVGISGGFSSPVADELIAESDFILGFGASLTQWTTKRGKLIAPGAVVAQVDIEAPKLGYQMPVQHRGAGRRQGDGGGVAGGARPARPDRSAGQAGRRSDAMRERIRAGDNHHFPHPDESSRAVHRSAHFEQGGRCDPAGGPRGGLRLRSFLRLGAALSAGAERARLVPEPFVPVGRPRLASAIGLAIANPGKLAVLGTGDGGFLMSIADLETAIRLGLRLCILVYNDSSYAAEVHYFGRQGFSTDIVQFPETDFAAIARGYGARGATVRTLADLDPVKAWVAEGAPGVFVIDGKINPDLEADWHAEHFPKRQSHLEIAAGRSRRQVMQHAALDQDDAQIGDAADHGQHDDRDEHQRRVGLAFAEA